MRPDPIFAERFEFPEGVEHARCEKTDGALHPFKHFEMTLPEDFGRATLDIYEHRGRAYSRAVSFKTGEVAWFAVTVNAVAVPSHEEPRP